jgi:mono/diheme cytochrome c family protein
MYLILAAAIPALTEPASAQGSTRPSQKEETAARAAGQRYAQENCAVCHAIDRSATRSPNPAAPSFAMIASTPGMTAMALNALLHSPHRSMPTLQVEPGAVANLAAYMRTLRDPALTRQLRNKANEPAILRPLAG